MSENKKDYRVEKDSIGAKDIPDRMCITVYSPYVQRKIFILQV